jgi:hypothetical protein
VQLEGLGELKISILKDLEQSKLSLSAVIALRSPPQIMKLTTNSESPNSAAII